MVGQFKQQVREIMKYINNTTGDVYYGGSLTIKHNNSLFSGIPTVEMLEEFGYEEVQEETPEPIEEDTTRQRMDEILQLLSNTDYIVLKKAEGIDISSYDEQYNGDFLAWRQSLRDEYNQLESSLDNSNDI